MTIIQDIAEKSYFTQVRFNLFDLAKWDCLPFMFN